MGKKQDKNDHLNPMPGPCQSCLSTITKRTFVWKKIEKIFSILNRKGSEEMKWNIFCFRQEPRWSLPWAGTFLKVSPAQRYLERCDMLKDQCFRVGFPWLKEVKDKDTGGNRQKAFVPVCGPAVFNIPINKKKKKPAGLSGTLWTGLHNFLLLNSFLSLHVVLRSVARGHFPSWLEVS